MVSELLKMSIGSQSVNKLKFFHQFKGIAIGQAPFFIAP